MNLTVIEKTGAAIQQAIDTIHASWTSKLLLKDFYIEPGGNGPDPNKYEVWISIRFQGAGLRAGI